MKKITGTLLVIVALVALAFTPLGVQAQSTVKNYFSGCTGVNCDNALTLGGTVTYHNVTFHGSKSGQVTLSGSNPTSVATGFTSIDGCNITLVTGSAPPLTEPVTFTVLTTAVTGRLDIYAWKVTSSGNAALIASTSSQPVQYDCTGS